jgi:hypothetical protein
MATAIPLPDRGQPLDVTYIYQMANAINSLATQISQASDNYTTIYTRDAGKQQIKTNSAKIVAAYYDVINNQRVETNQVIPFNLTYSDFKYPPIVTATVVKNGTSEIAYDANVVLDSVTESRVDGKVKFYASGDNVSVTINLIAIGIAQSSDII